MAERLRFNHGESVIFIAYLLGKPVGFAQLYPSFSSVSLKRIFILNDLYVISEARSNGVGCSLVEHAKNYAETLGAIRLSLSTAISNTIAQSMYKKIGWVKEEQFLVYQFQIQS